MATTSESIFLTTKYVSIHLWLVISYQLKGITPIISGKSKFKL